MPENLRTGNLEIDRQLDAMADQLECFTEAQDRFAAMEITGSALDGLIQVRVGATGVLLDVQINPRAMRNPSEILSEALLEAYRAATFRAAEQVGELLRGVVPAPVVEGLTSGSVIGPDGEPVDPRQAAQQALARLRRT